MAGKSAIEWTGHTWNPLAGCSVLTPGCTNCYAMKMAARLEAMGQPLYKGLTKPSKAGPVWTGIMRQAPKSVLGAPLDRRKPTTYFVNSMSDLFHEKVPDEWILDIVTVMAIAHQHTFQVLTKRADRMREFMSRPGLLEDVYSNWFTFSGGPREVQSWPLPNLWLGVSTERQKEADERIPLLLQTPAAVRFISAEPLLGPLDITKYIGGRTYRCKCGWHDTEMGLFLVGDRARCHKCDQWCDIFEGIKWVIPGGESGPNARPPHPAWVRSLRDQCNSADTHFFFKQWGNWQPDEPEGSAGRGNMVAWPDGTVGPGKMEDHGGPGVHMFNVGKKRAGRLLDGITHDAIPSPSDQGRE